MSRSRRKQPIYGGATSAKISKQQAHRTERARVRDHLAHERWDEARWPRSDLDVYLWGDPHEYRYYHSPWDAFYNKRCWCIWHQKYQWYYNYPCDYCSGKEAKLHRKMMRK